MSQVHYVALAYAVFAIAMAWDYLMPRLHLRRVRRHIQLRARRDAQRKNT